MRTGLPSGSITMQLPGPVRHDRLGRALDEFRDRVEHRIRMPPVTGDDRKAESRLPVRVLLRDFGDRDVEAIGRSIEHLAHD